MNQLMKLAPWLLSAVLAISLIFNWQQSHVALEQKDVEVQRIKQQYAQLISEANKKIEVANQREVQVQVSFRKAILGSGYVAVLSNMSNQSIAITADIERPATGQKKSFSIIIDNRKEIGELQGWGFVSGDTIKVSQPNHRALTFTMR